VSLPTFTRSLRSDPRELEHILPDLANFLGQHEVEGSVTYVVELCVEELLLNAMTHGYHGATDRPIAMHLELHDSRNATLDVEDEGDPFDLRSAPEPDFDGMLDGDRIGGLGVHLVRSLANSVEYQRINNRNHVRIRILPLPLSQR
jgi:anti-sigma regulatory factor (Ser/Thr protein kinase)